MSELKWTQYPTLYIPDKITGNYGDWYPGASHPHMGVDVGIYTGTPIYAPAHGIMSGMLNDGSFGIAACINHVGTGWYSAYCHLSSIAAPIGREVNAGDLIGYSGNTGLSTGPHLHWQVCNSPYFYAEARYNRDPMLVPFVTPEDDMTPDQEKLLLLIASVVGGWSNGQVFQSVEEALPSYEIFEAPENDTRVIIGMGAMQGDILNMKATMEAHIATTAAMGEEIDRLFYERNAAIRTFVPDFDPNNYNVSVGEDGVIAVTAKE